MRANVVHARAGIFGPGTLRLEAQIVNPMLERELLLAALLVHGSEIEVRVGVVGDEPDGARQVRGGSVEIAEFVERATQIEMRDGVVRKDRERFAK